MLYKLTFRLNFHPYNKIVLEFRHQQTVNNNVEIEMGTGTRCS